MTALFEVSWEVCNKVGGIHTVVSSKAHEMIEHYTMYYLVGPYFADKVRGIFEEEPAPRECKGCVDTLSQYGIKVHVGKWLIKGTPRVLLIDYSELRSKTNEIKRHLWDTYTLDSLGTLFYDFDEPLVWAWACGIVIEKWAETIKEPIVVHGHEWLSGATLLYIKEHMPKVATVFTTHATMLGRTLASQEYDLYGKLESLDAPREAKNRGASVWAKYQLERILAHECDVFTTVSEITSIEAKKILDKSADMILPNGLDSDQFPTLEEASIRRNSAREKIEMFLIHYFFPYYSFDLDNTLVFFTGGRYEFRSKGLDVLIDALSDLNDKLVRSQSKKTVVVFLWIPANVRGIKPEIIENRALFYDVKDTLDDGMNALKNRIAQLILAEKQVSIESIFDDDALIDLKIKSRRFKRSGIPSVLTHDLHDEEYDPILRRLKEHGLTNSAEHRVKVIYYPLYLAGADGLLDLTYYESACGSDLGIFASYYEPWGYTPLESAALATSAITTDLAGFGAYVKARKNNSDMPGVIVLSRRGIGDAQVVLSLANEMYYLTNQSKQARVQNRIAAKHIANQTDWEHFIKYYLEAHELAMKKAQARFHVAK